MSIHVALFHRTRYSYDRAVSHAPHVVRLRPAPHCRTQVLSYSLKIGGGPSFLNWQQDPFSNWNGRLVLPEPMREFVVDVELVVQMAVHNPFDFFLDEAAAAVPFHYEAALRKELAPFLEFPQAGPLLSDYVATVRRELEGPLASGSPLRTIDFMVSLNQRIQRDVKYVIRMEPGVQPPELT